MTKKNIYTHKKKEQKKILCSPNPYLLHCSFISVVLFFCFLLHYICLLIIAGNVLHTHAYICLI
jgi:hypothetical protein